ncbi:NlpC/P60 family protein [Nonomuraea sp. NPDC050328]|uniref:NlpC/P60 family protein n=1 Tax=Nonomuraea sp. NPDC050328 TaxID=3364361 RepID=UPI0037929F2C
MPSLMRNLRIVLGVDLDERGLKRADRALADIDRRLGKLGRTMAVSAGLTGLAGGATALVGALLPAAGAVMALPGAMAIAKTATAALKVGVIGLGDAFEAVASGDADALQKSLTKLSPSARRLVLEANGLKGMWDPIQQAVQQQLFSRLDRQLQPVARNLLPTVRGGMLDIAGATNRAAREAAGFAKTPLARGATAATLGATSRTMGLLASATRPALSLVARLTVASLPLAERMAAWGTNGIKAASGFVASERGAAKLTSTVDRAGDTLAQLGRITGNVGGAMGAIFGRMEDDGEGVLDTIEKVTARFEAWTKTARGQQAIADALGLLRDVLGDVGDVLPLVTGPLGLVASLLTSLPGPLRDVVTQGLALALVVGPLAGKMGGLASGVLHMVAASRDADTPLGRLRDRMGEVADRASGGRGGMGGRLAGVAGMLAAAGPWGLAIAGGVTALAIFANRNAESAARVADLSDALYRNKGALDADAISKVKNTLETEGVYQAAQKLGINLSLVTDAALGNKAALGQLNAQLQTHAVELRVGAGRVGSFATGQKQLVGGALLVSNAVSGTNSELSEAAAQYQRLTAAEPKLTQASNSVAAGITKVGGSASRAWTDVALLNTQLVRFRSLSGDADMAAIGFHEALDGLSGALKRNNLQIDQRTGKFNLNNKVGRENNKLVIDAIRSAVDHASKVKEETNSVDKANRVFATHIDRLRGVMSKAGLSKEAIDRLIRRYTTLPGDINAALRAIRDRNIRIKVSADGKVWAPGWGGSYATGGVLPGYTPGKDVHQFVSPTGGRLALSGGEAVMRPEWVKAVGRDYVERANGAARRGGVTAVAKQLGLAGDPGGVVRGFADGGIIAGGDINVMPGIRRAVTTANNRIDRIADRIADRAVKKVEEVVGGPGKRAVRAARSQLGVPYSWGGGGPAGPSYGFAQGANIRGFDCSSLMQYAWYKATGRVSPRTTYSQAPWVNRIPGPRPGAFGFPHAGHVFMASDRPGRIIEAPFTGARVREVPARSAWWGMPPWKFDEGGVMPPGYGTYYNGTGQPEYVFTQQQMRDGGGPVDHGGFGLTIHNHFHIPNHPNKHEIGREIYESLQPYMQRSKRKLPT